ncbi:MAG: hypothetical protein Unbinned7913contig1002_47 [Prokaryotic dsDNA virus sp.]|jgi:hypothetical protein|nr:MAG: hypothetical protein Unbinned7913contig1002_47 [Prokaryotic dsDNA virus sp.]
MKNMRKRITKDQIKFSILHQAKKDLWHLEYQVRRNSGNWSKMLRITGGAWPLTIIKEYRNSIGQIYSRSFLARDNELHLIP